MNYIQWLIIADLLFSGVAIFIRGLIHNTRTYTMQDGIFGLLECLLLVWLVSTL